MPKQQQQRVNRTESKPQGDDVARILVDGGKEDGQEGDDEEGNVVGALGVADSSCHGATTTAVWEHRLVRPMGQQGGAVDAIAACVGLQCNNSKQIHTCVNVGF